MLLVGRMEILQPAESTATISLSWTKDFVLSKLSKLKREYVADNQIFSFMQDFLIILELQNTYEEWV